MGLIPFFVSFSKAFYLFSVVKVINATGEHNTWDNVLLLL